MNLVATIFSVALVFMDLRGVNGNGCANADTYNNTVINMCEQRIWTLGRVFISVTSVGMGSSTRCSCTLRSRTPGMNTSSLFNLRSNDSHVNKCDQSQIHINLIPPLGDGVLQNFTCTSPFGSNAHTGITTSNVTITLTRLDTSVEVSYCVLVLPDRWLANDTVLSCQSDVTQPGSTATSTTLSASSDALQKSSTESVGEGTSTVGPVAGGVIGAIVVLAIIIVVLVLCVRRRSRQKATELGSPEVEAESHFSPRLEEDLSDPNYSTADDVAPATNGMPSNTSSTTVASSSSQARLLNEMFSESSSPYELVDEMPRDNGRVSINPVAGTASMTPATKDTQPQKTTGDEYSVVNKPKGKKPANTPPAKPPKPKGLSASSETAEATAATTESGDIYAAVDKSRRKGGNAKKKSDPPSQTEAPSSTGMTYANLEELRSASRPPARLLPETEYTTIDHVATANLASEA